jgi:hypothetical protein
MKRAMQGCKKRVIEWFMEGVLVREVREFM